MKRLAYTLAAAFLATAVAAQTYRGSERPPTVEEKLNNEYCTGLFKSADGVILDVASNISTAGHINILDWLQGRVAGLQILTTRMGVRIPFVRGQVPGIYVDEIPVPASFIQSLSIPDIAIIKIIKTPFYGGFNGGGGAVAIYTLRGEDDEEEEE